MRVRSALLACAVLTATLAGTGLAACSSDDDNSIGVSLLDYDVRPKVSSTKSGEVTFKVKNNGTFVHEFVVVKSDGNAVPTKPDGEANEDAIKDDDHLGEVEDIDPGDTKDLKVTMSPGSYELFCNRVDGKTSHYAKGMHADFTVTGS